jgi:hypothetical protein
MTEQKRTNAKVLKARAARHSVRVGRIAYRSVAEAFRAHDWPMGIHKRVRLEVVANGHAVVNGRTITLVRS